METILATLFPFHKKYEGLNIYDNNHDKTNILKCNLRTKLVPKRCFVVSGVV